MMRGTAGRVTVIGAGTIGLSWIVLLLAYGWRVCVNSRSEGVRERIHEALRLYGPTVAGAEIDPEELSHTLEVESDLERAVASADVVLENAPDSIELKQELFARIGDVVGPRSLLLSSTSKFPPEELGKLMENRGRLVVGHPFNPPHLVPLVEIVSDDGTSKDAIEEAFTFYRSLDRTPVSIRKPMPMFVANRLQAALLRESVHLVREGVVTVEELDTIVTRSIGLRWAVIGPFHTFHLGGGPGGLRQWLTHLGAGLERGWQQLGQPPMDHATTELLIEQTERAYGRDNYADLVAKRDARQSAVLEALDRSVYRKADPRDDRDVEHDGTESSEIDF